MKYIIDRFEGQYAVCEDEQGQMVNIEISKIPEAAVEGDVLVYTAAGYEIDTEETGKRKNKINELAEELWKD
jgi:uncharacterized protein (AIM24 family)